MWAHPQALPFTPTSFLFSFLPDGISQIRSLCPALLRLPSAHGPRGCSIADADPVGQGGPESLHFKHAPRRCSPRATLCIAKRSSTDLPVCASPPPPKKTLLTPPQGFLQVSPRALGSSSFCQWGDTLAMFVVCASSHTHALSLLSYLCAGL